METWSSRLGVGRRADEPTPEKVQQLGNLRCGLGTVRSINRDDWEKSIKGGEGPHWTVEPSKKKKKKKKKKTHVNNLRMYGVVLYTSPSCIGLRCLRTGC
jgi:hypothetical protein